MSSILLILIILICVTLSFFVLIQNPKGGGMSGTFGGFGNSVMGAKQSSDAVEKGTWYTMLALALVVLLSFVLMPKTNNAATGNEAGEPLKASSLQQPMPQPQAPAPTPVGEAEGTATPAAPAQSDETPAPGPNEGGEQPAQ